jgi:hypothetical protein
MLQRRKHHVDGGESYQLGKDLEVLPGRHTVQEGEYH